MQRKGMTLILCIAALGCLSGTYLFLKNQNAKTEEKEAEAASGDTILEIDSGEITALSFQTAEGISSFVLQGDMWIKEDDETFPVDSSALLAPLSQLSPLKAVRTLTDVENADDFGFDEAQNTISLTDSEGTETILTIGASNQNTGDDYLMMNQDSSIIYTIDSAVCSAFSANLYDYAYSEELPVLLAADISGVEVQQGEKRYHLYLEDAVWKVSGSAGGDESEDTVGGTAKDADSDAVNTALSGLSNLAYVDFLDHNCTELAVYGLDEPSAVITISYLEEVETESEAEGGSSETEIEPESELESETEVTTVEHKLSFTLGAQDASGNYYVQKEGSSEVHTIRADTVSTFLSQSYEGWVAEGPETEVESETAEESEAEIYDEGLMLQ